MQLRMNTGSNHSGQGFRSASGGTRNESVSGREARAGKFSILVMLVAVIGVVKLVYTWRAKRYLYPSLV